MNVINQLESDSSSDSDGIVMEDRVAEENGKHSENVLDLAETSSTQAISINLIHLHVVEPLLFPC